MIEALFDRFLERLSLLRLPRRWDGRNISAKGTMHASFRVIDGSLPGLTSRWAQHFTAIAEGHLWVGRRWVSVRAIDPASGREPHRNEAMSLDADTVVDPVTTRSGAACEWALRADQLAKALQLSGN